MQLKYKLNCLKNINKQKIYIMQKALLSTIAAFFLFATAFAQTPDAGENQIVCSSQIYLNGNEPPEGTVGNWSVLTGSGNFENPALHNTLVSDVSFGPNTFRWSFNDLFDDVTITNNTLFAYAGEDQMLLTNNATYMAATLPQGADGQWSITSGGGIIQDLSDPTTLISELPEGVNTFMWTVSQNDCTDNNVIAIIFDPSTEANIITKDELKIYPLPANEEVTVEFPKQEEYIVEIYSITGSLIKTVSNNGKKIIKIDTNEMNSGIYHFNIINQNFKFNYNIVIQK